MDKIVKEKTARCPECGKRLRKIREGIGCEWLSQRKLIDFEEKKYKYEPVWENTEETLKEWLYREKKEYLVKREYSIKGYEDVTVIKTKDPPDLEVSYAFKNKRSVKNKE